MSVFVDSMADYECPNAVDGAPTSYTHGPGPGPETHAFSPLKENLNYHRK